MKYQEIVNLALSYSDRKDSDITVRMDDFLRVVESRVNRVIRVIQMSTRSIVVTTKDQEYFGLPELFAGIRDIEVRNKDATKGQTASYLSPEQMNGKTSDNTSANLYYTILANQIQIFPPQSDKVLEIVYYQRLDPLTAENDSNWLSDRYPDVYVFALLVEITSFVKNMDGAAMWEQRLEASMTEMREEDSKDRWSGPALTIKIG